MGKPLAAVGRHVSSPNYLFHGFNIFKYLVVGGLMTGCGGGSGLSVLLGGMESGRDGEW